MATLLVFLAPASRAAQELDTNPCAGRSEVSCQAPGLIGKPVVAWRNTFTKADGQQMETRLASVLDLVLQAPLLHEPKGMSLHPTMLAGPPPAGAEKSHPPQVELSILAKLIKVEDKGAKRDKATGAWIGTGEGPMLRMRFNDLGAFLSPTPLDFKTPAQYFYEPVKVGDINGFPVYQVGGKEILLVQRHDAMPWRPYPVERFVQARIADEEKTFELFQKQLASADAAGRVEIGKANDVRSARLDAMRQWLSQLSAAQRQAGACESRKIRRGDPVGLDLACGPGSVALVEPNQSMFSGRAGASLHILAISTTWGVLPKDDRLPNALGRKVRAALQEVDLKALQGMLD